MPAAKHPRVLRPGVLCSGWQVWVTRHQGSIKQLEGPRVHLNVKGDTAERNQTEDTPGNQMEFLGLPVICQRLQSNPVRCHYAALQPLVSPGQKML